ncbi:hypothetical protein [Flavobacterium sp.]|uniref:bestrophin-like domain n=1 Tax=Flavobacterium sp. TaxID=239 RepID=UPI002487263E|nr:hypothetical protein [Flavobacterium sp.]MDI1315840.1 hypothetical protein [Flavobacterium sp.]
MSYLNEFDAWKIASLLMLTIFALTYFGYKAGNLKLKKLKVKTLKESSSSFSSLSGLLFLLLAFTFGMSVSRYDSRRQVIVEESNAISTAFLRADLYTEKERVLFKKDFKLYIESRINYYKAGKDQDKIKLSNSVTQSISTRLWQRASKLSFDHTNTDATRLMIPALNEMIDITTTRAAGEKAKVPDSIIWLLFVLACFTSFYSGYSAALKGSIDWLVEFGFCMMISVTVLFIFDLDRPFRGLVTLDESNKNIIELSNNFN